MECMAKTEVVLQILMIFGIGLATWSLAQSSGAIQLVPESTGTGKRKGKRNQGFPERKTLIDDDIEEKFEQLLQRLGETAGD